MALDLSYLKFQEDIPDDEILKKAVFISFVAHISIFLIFSLKTLIFPHEAINLDAAIKVDMVDLPDKVQSLPEAAEPPAAKALEAPKEITREAAKPAPREIPKTAVVLNPKKELANEKIEKFKKEQKRLKMLEDIDKEVRADEAKQKSERVAKIKATLLKGNKVSAGTSLSGLNRSVYQDYTSEILGLVKSHWDLPGWLQSDNLVAVVRVYIDYRGVVTKRFVEKSSGNETFDEYALKTVDASSPFPKPPERLADVFKEDGMHLNMSK